MALADEASLLHYRINAALEVIHGGEPGIAARRAVLRNLLANGPLTVPQLAALRPVSRQHMQRVVGALLAAGEAAREPNPAHRRSDRVRLTERGRAALRGFAEREAPLLAAAEGAVEGGEVEQATALLRRLRARLDEVAAAVEQQEHP